MIQKVIKRIIVNGLFGLSTIVVLLVALHVPKDEVIVAVLDTGVDDSHPLLQGKVIQGYDFVDFDSVSDDMDGHGTHVAGIIASKAPEAKILSVRVISSDNRLLNTHLAILYAIAKGASIINMSYAESYHWLTEMAIRYGQLKGVVFVASAGNKGINDTFYPAKYKGVFSISGLNEQENAVYGNYGAQVNYLAPSVSIRSAGLNGSYTTKSGTSMASAYVSGVLAFLKTNQPALTKNGLVAILDENAKTLKVVHENTDHSVLYKIVDFINVKHNVSGNNIMADYSSNVEQGKE